MYYNTNISNTHRPLSPPCRTQTFFSNWARERRLRRNFVLVLLSHHRLILSQHIIENMLPRVVLNEIRQRRLSRARVGLAPLSWSFPKARSKIYVCLKKRKEVKFSCNERCLSPAVLA